MLTPDLSPGVAWRGSGGNYGDSLPRQLLAQLRWLDNVVAGQRLTEKLCEALQACPLYLRREIITALPEIIDDYAYEVRALLAIF